MRLQPVITSFAGLAAVAVLAACSAQAKQEQTAAAPPVQVTVTDVAFKSLRQWDDFTGRLEPIDTVEIRPRVSGYIDGARFAEGARVSKGQVLFQIDPRPYQAEADRAAAEVARAKAQLDLAVVNRERGRRLIEQNALAQSEFDRLSSEERAAQANVSAAQAALQTARLNLQWTKVTSPIDGRVSKAIITRGNLVTQASLLTTVVSDTPIYAAFNADEQTFLKYAAAERGKESPVYMGLMTEDGYPHVGKLTFIDNALDAKSGTINGRAIFANADGKFTPGLFARIRLVSAESREVALAPDRAVATDLGKRYVVVVNGSNKAEYRPVEIGPLAGNLRIIRSGLKPGDRVIVGGLQKVKPGDTVAPVKVKTELADLGQLEVGGRQIVEGRSTGQN
ncbi:MULTISPECIES: efflux RND transporter periplasmic adaptor subunit [Caulobacter]|jgi:multidrug efflux system membrane fusion protein|uniref:RND family efflux transporter, MFP subunit n=1 Tax=Caulobacter vibrioides OR37 TaxID=1292034 RepID=R0ELN7_CAUVI|nr:MULTISPECIES: efflux RND transporter periplasmic adaptor subunit [Caulobacter]ENZ82017.1 RND family efflux transporter, MFP subunit [Caulobacter vibrioides OR37]MBQ1560968.1 efflux RND transporter periplasmic adaptor subunit [Caulobacter sp.]